MSNPYLARLREKLLLRQPSKPSKPNFEGPEPSFEGFEGDHGRHIFPNRSLQAVAPFEERGLLTQPSKPSKISLAECLSGLECECPAFVEPARWQQCIGDAQHSLRSGVIRPRRLAGRLAIYSASTNLALIRTQAIGA
jgi:hypothetical protein